MDRLFVSGPRTRRHRLAWGASVWLRPVAAAAARTPRRPAPSLPWVRDAGHQLPGPDPLLQAPEGVASRGGRVCAVSPVEGQGSGVLLCRGGNRLGVLLCSDGGTVDRVGVEWPDPRPQQIMPLSAGTRLGHYDVTALLGEGGMGRVWQA